LSLAQAFDLLKRVLREMGALAPTVVGEDPVRERMAEVHGNAQDPLFHRPRFGRLLRQAQDAGIVDLSKNEKGFEMALRAEAAAAAAEPQPERAGEESRGRRGHRGGRGRGERREMLHAPQDTEQADAPPVSEEVHPVAAPAPPAPHAITRGLRFRRGSGGPVVPPGGVPLVGVVEIEETAEAPKEKPAPRRRSRAGAARRGTARRPKGKRAPEEPSSES
jgi:hypothetical protein